MEAGPRVASHMTLVGTVKEKIQRISFHLTEMFILVNTTDHVGENYYSK